MRNPLLQPKTEIDRLPRPRSVLRALTSSLILAATSGVAAQPGPRVIAVHPTPQSIAPTVRPEIVVRFDTAIDPASVDRRSFSVFGRWAGVSAGEILFEDENRQIRFLPADDFSAGEWITVSLASTIQSASAEPLAQGYAWNFWTASQTGSLELELIDVLPVRQDGEDRIRTYGAYAGDLDGDGFHDFTVPNEDSHDIRVFLNDGAGRYGAFKRYPVPDGSRPSTNEGADFNGDGLLDFAVGNIKGGTVSVFLGDGAGGFLGATTYPVGAGTRGLCVIDLDTDGAIDIVVANRASSDVAILMNRGDGTFAQSFSLETGVSGETSCAVADANEDGVLDVFVGSFSSQEIVLLVGDGQGGLTVATRAFAGGSAWMIAAADVDNDGHVDVVSANSVQDEFALLRGDGQGNLRRPEVYPSGRFPLAIDLGDLDGDGDLDVVTSNISTADWTLYENDGAGNFINRRTLQAGSAGSCAVLHDRDRDGDLDLTGIDELDDLLFLFENPGSVTRVEDTPGERHDALPRQFRLLQSYPNPFRQGDQHAVPLVIPFVLNRAGTVRLELVNIQGRLVAVLLDSNLPAGRHEVRVDGVDLPPGVYLYRLRSAYQSETRKLVLLPPLR